MNKNLAFVISPHGFGHAARDCAVMAALAKIDPEIKFHIYTTVPKWFFEDSLKLPFFYHPFQVDVGLIQKTPLEIDIPRSIHTLTEFYGDVTKQMEILKSAFLQHQITAVVADVAPIGLRCANSLGLPAMLLSNFTWDWIYQNMGNTSPAFLQIADVLKSAYQVPFKHIQTSPPCPATIPVHYKVGPISRRPDQSVAEVRAALGLEKHQPLVTIALGGIPVSYNLNQLVNYPNYQFVVLSDGAEIANASNIIQLPHRSGFQTASLFAASNLVVGKPGYSTIAELVCVNTPFAYVSRKDFPESAYLEMFIRQNIPSIEIPMKSFQNGTWMEEVLPLCKETGKIIHQNADMQTAEIIYSLL